jgi:hypothetical protein
MTVRTVLIWNYSPNSVVRVESRLERYTLSSKLFEVVLIAAKPGKNIVLLGYSLVRYFRRRG